MPRGLRYYQKNNAIMTAMDIRTSINNGLAGFTPDMLLVVDDFVKSLRRRMVEPHKARLWDPETGEYLNAETMALVERVRNGEEPMQQLDSMDDFKAWCEAL